MERKQLEIVIRQKVHESIIGTQLIVTHEVFIRGLAQAIELAESDAIHQRHSIPSSPVSHTAETTD